MSTQQVVTAAESLAFIAPGSYRVQRPASPQDVISLIEKHQIQIVDLKFTDLPGMWQHFSITPPEVHEGLFSEGIGFDGSSIRGFQEIHESDMLLKPDPTTAFVDPICAVPTLSIICDVHDPVLDRSYTRDPRYIARKAEEYLKGTGIAQTCYFGPELEFFIFDSVRFGQDQHSGYYYIESAEGEWNSGADEGAYGGGNLATSRATRKATSPCRRTTRCRTSVRRSCSR
jgi:glutamine synthetase